MLFPNSFLRHSGQFWKLKLSFFGILLSGVVMFAGKYFIVDPNAEIRTRGGMLLLGGTALSLGCFIFAVVAIRCPYCRNRLFWEAVSKKDRKDWLPWLLSQDSCPNCKTPGKLTIRN